LQVFFLDKGGFFSQSAIRFSNLKASKKNIQKTILNFKFKIPAQNSIMLWNFKLQVQDSFWKFFWGIFGDLKKKSHFLKKSHLTSYYLCILDDFDK
jgi:hypothetical protein